MKSKFRIRDPKDGTPFVLRLEDGSLLPVHYNAQMDLYEDAQGTLYFSPHSEHCSPGDIANGLLHAADDHACCKATLHATANIIIQVEHALHELSQPLCDEGNKLNTCTRTEPIGKTRDVVKSTPHLTPRAPIKATMKRDVAAVLLVSDDFRCHLPERKNPPSQTTHHKKKQMESLQTIMKAPIMLAACFDALEKGIQLKNPEKVDALINDLESAVPIVEKWMRGEKSQKNPHHEIGQMAFDLIPIANRLIAGKSQDVFRDAMDIQKGLHAIEFKACRWADRISLPNTTRQ